MMTCCEATREMKARVADRIVERTGMERDIFTRDSQAFGRVLDRIASARDMTREDVALELYYYHYTADALEAACNGGLVDNPRDFILALEDALSLDRREVSELLFATHG